MIYVNSGQLAAHGPHVARHSVFKGPRKQLGKNFNQKIPPT